jgi:hypothetical protein
VVRTPRRALGTHLSRKRVPVLESIELARDRIGAEYLSIRLVREPDTKVETIVVAWPSRPTEMARFEGSTRGGRQTTRA